MTGLIRRVGGLFKRGGDGTLQESIENAIEEHGQRQEGGEDSFVLRPDQRDLLSNILDNGDVRIEDIMVHRSDIIAFDVATPFEHMIDRFIDASHSRLPVYQGDLDHCLGMIHVKDVLSAMKAHAQGEPAPAVETLKRPVLFVPPSMRALDLLAKMRAVRIHMAIVIDEYGGSDGLVTIEDLVEQVVGDINDEHDQDEELQILAAPDGGIDVDARVEIEKLEQVLDRALTNGDGRDDDVDTIGGLVFTLAGSVPQIGDVIDDDHGIAYEILDADPRRIKRVRVRLDDDPAGKGSD